MIVNYDMLHAHGVADHTIGAIRRYIEERIPPGGFLSAVICNDLKGAVGAADCYNLPKIPEIVRWFFNYAPSVCWGSPRRFTAWLEGGSE